MSEMHERQSLTNKLISNTSLTSDENRDTLNAEKVRYEEVLETLY